MKRTLLLAALVLFAFVSTQAQTLDEVLEKHYKATGQEKVESVKTISVKAKMSMMGMDMPMTIQMKKPDKFRTENEVMGQKVIAGFDGEKGWMKNPMAGSGITDLGGAELKKAMNEANILESSLFNYTKKGYSAELIGKVSSDGEPAYRVKLTKDDGSVEDYYINADNYLVSKVKAKVKSMGQTVDVETKVLEYKDFNGIKVGVKMEVENPMGTISMVLEDVKLDEEMDDAIFARPSE